MTIKINLDLDKTEYTITASNFGTLKNKMPSLKNNTKLFLQYFKHDFDSMVDVEKHFKNNKSKDNEII